MTSRGDTFGALYRAHAPSVYRRALRLLDSESDANDIVSEVFLSLYERPDQFAGKSELSTFLYSMTTNACLNRMRTHKRRLRLLAGAPPIAYGTAPTAPDVLVQLRALLDTLPDGLAQVAVYRYLDRLSQQEIAEIMQCSRRHVGTLLARLHAFASPEKSA